MSGAPARPEVIGAFRRQVEWCDKLGSPFTARLLEAAAADLEAGGPVADLLGQWPGDPGADALALRYAGALHALAASGSDGDLTTAYPLADRPGDALAAPSAARRALERDPDYFREFLKSPPQTNEVGRSGALLGGFLAAARATGLPLRLLEIGASAGLNLVFDRFGYRLGTATWGNPASPVSLSPAWSGPLPDLDAPLSVVSREGCDLRPSDLEDAAQRSRLRSYIWPDQFERLARFDGAVALARAAKVKVVQADAAEWIDKRLTERRSGAVNVVFHSIVWQYLPAATKSDIEASIGRAGGNATAETPVAWLRLEPDGPGDPYLKLTLWPGGEMRTLARAHFHGASVDWMGA